MVERRESQAPGSSLPAAAALVRTVAMRPQNAQLGPREETCPTSARRLWALLRQGIQATTEKMKKEELKAAQLTHGLQHVRHLSFSQPVRQVAYNSRASLFAVLDAQSRMHLHRADGWLSRGVPAPAPITGLLYAAPVNKYVAWDQSNLQVLGPAFEVLSKVSALHGVHCCLYSPELNQVVTTGAGSLSVWAFRYGFHQLQCQLTVQQGLSPRDAFTRLALGTGPSQACFAASGTGVAVFSIDQGELVTFQRDLHNRAITDLAYCEAAACVVTASRDTTIKVWDEKWLIQTIFVGHTGPVTAVTIYPQRPLILSASQDGTLRTWNLQTIDQVDEMHVAEVVEQLQTHPEEGYVVSLSGTTMDLWKVNQLYSLHSRLGAAVTRISTVDLSGVGSFPVRAVCVCQDSCVRLVAAHTGQVVSTLLLDRPCQAMEVAYCLPKEMLFVLLEQGQLLRVNAAVNPMRVKKTVVPRSESARPCCLLLYSQLVEPQKAYAQWQEIREQGGDRRNWAQLPLKLQDKNKYLLVLGQEDGSLCVLHWFTGHVQHRVEAHSWERVTALAASPHDTYIISAGGDRTVKLWRIFPYVEESLTLLLSFSCPQPALHMCLLGSTLGAALQDPETATYSVVQYDLLAQSRQEHSPEDDPLDEITGLCCCPRLKLFASASRDGSVRVWNARNQLLRHLRLNAVPESLAFANDRGDLLLGLEQHLYCVRHSQYLPRPYLTKLLCASLLDPVADSPLPVSQSAQQALGGDARQRLLLEPSSRTRPAKLHAPLIRWKPQADKDWSQACQEKEEACAELAARDQDLLLIQQAKLSTPQKSRLNQQLRDEAFERYMHLVYRQQPRIQIPHTDAFDADMVLEACLAGESVPYLYVPAASHPFLGAFPCGAEEHADPPLLKAPAADGLCPEDTPEPRAGRGSRSALPAPSTSKVLDDALHSPLLAAVRSQISQAPAADGLCPEDTPEPRTGHGSRSALPAPNTSDLLGDALCSTSLAAVRGQISQARQVAVAASKNQHSSSRSWSPSRKILTGKSREHSTSQDGAEEEDKEVARSVVIPELSSVPLPVPGRKESILLTQPDASEHGRLRGEIPGFILQFEAMDWFQQLYLFRGAVDSLRGLSVSGFVHQLLEALLAVDDALKPDIVQAILTLHEQVGLGSGQEVCKALLHILHRRNPPTLAERTQRRFVLAALKGLVAFCRDQEELLLELMATFLRSPASSRGPLKALFRDVGLEDPHSYFYQELEAWDLAREKPGSAAALRRTCARWLEGVMQDLQAKRAAGRSEAFPAASSPEASVEPIDAINHFCKMQLKRDLENLKQPESAGRWECANAVLALPSIGRSQAILRLGETNALARKRPPQRFYLPRIFPLPLLKGFVHAIKLPVPRINMNPFPSDSDMPSSENTFISMRQKVQKYFIPKFSFADSYP
ncbi:WD repeat-containing protein 97 isoform X2 [Carettochelys insculpta]|uniref:WD repeat-containing protein 97 isoform X2 n=1 Tax=Carettochelys insculpta TaxID=44489 RepID=UPI003EBEFDEC